MSFAPPETFNIADHFLDARVHEGRGERTAVRTVDGDYSYRRIQTLANRFGNLLVDAGVEPEQRVLIALPDGLEFVGALFGVLKIGAIVVMVNPRLKTDAATELLEYSQAAAVFLGADEPGALLTAAQATPHIKSVFMVGSEPFAERLSDAGRELETFRTHRDDPAIWLFSGGTSGAPKAVVQTHRSFANTTECYGRNVLGLGEDDVTLSIPRLYFGYATGSNLFFPFAVGATAALYAEHPTVEIVFEKIAAFRPTILVNVPTMVNRMVRHPDAARQDFSSIRIATSAGEALPVELHRRWNDVFGVELLDGLGTAEMWHIFLSNRPGDVRPGTLGRAVPGFDVRVCDDDGRPVPTDEVGRLWVRGDSLALGYWQAEEKTRAAFRGPWYVSEDMLSVDADGYFTYCGRADDMLKVSGKWLSPKEVENCLLERAEVSEVAVVGVVDDEGLVIPSAFVVTDEGTSSLAETLEAHVRARLESYKCPRSFAFLDAMPRTHLGKIDRGRLRSG